MTDKELWTLYQDSKQTVAEIAAIAGKSHSTIKRRLRGIDIRWEQPRLDGTGGFVQWREDWAKEIHQWVFLGIGGQSSMSQW